MPEDGRNEFDWGGRSKWQGSAGVRLTRGSSIASAHSIAFVSESANSRPCLGEAIRILGVRRCSLPAAPGDGRTPQCPVSPEPPGLPGLRLQCSTTLPRNRPWSVRSVRSVCPHPNPPLASSLDDIWKEASSPQPSPPKEEREHRRERLGLTWACARRTRSSPGFNRAGFQP
jgi:hypothetical protein